MCVFSGVGIWTAYEVLFMHMWATDKIPTVYYDWWSSPVYSFGADVDCPLPRSAPLPVLEGWTGHLGRRAPFRLARCPSQA